MTALHRERRRVALPWGCLLSLTGFLFPQYENKLFLISQSALMGEIALVLWLIIKGAEPSVLEPATSSSAV